MNDSAALAVENLACVRGDRRLFEGLDLALNPGELLYLRGHNGAGKSTLLRALCGLLLPEQGEIRWHGDPIGKVRDEYGANLLHLGHLNGLKGDLTAVENLRIDAALRGQVLSEDAAWETLSNVGLPGHEDLPSKYLSQGQKRRVALARLWISKVPLWILDEPFSALDVAAVEALQQVIRDHLAGGGMVILTTHQEVPLTDGHAGTITLGGQKRA